jgi:hypothetical protein
MKGTIVTRILKNGSKKYNAVWRVDGKQKWKSFERRKDADRHLADAVKATHDGTYKDVTPTRMNVVFDRWVSEWLTTRVMLGLIKASTAKSYTSMLSTHLRPAFGEIRSDRLRAGVIEDWSKAKADKINNGRMAPKSYNNILVLLHSILEWARRPDQGYLAHDPLVNLELLTPRRVECAFLDPTGIAALLAAVDNVRDSTVIKLAVYSGLRRGEIFALKWGDIDWQAGRISVRHGISAGVLDTPKTKHSIRGVDIPCTRLPQQLPRPLPGAVR